MLPGEIRVLVTPKIRNILEFIILKYTESKIIRDYYRENASDVYDEVFTNLFCSNSEFPINKIDEIPVDNDIFIISPRKKLRFDPNTTGYDPDTQTIINSELLNPELAGSFKLLPKLKSTPLLKRDPLPSLEVPILNNQVVNQKILQRTCNFIEILPLVRHKNNASLNLKSDIPESYSLFSKIEKSDSHSSRSNLKLTKLIMPKIPKKPKNNSMFENPFSHLSSQTRPLNGFTLTVGNGGFRKNSFNQRLDVKERKALKSFSLPSSTPLVLKENPLQVPKMTDIIKEIQSIDSFLKTSLTKNEIIILATEFCSLEIKCKSKTGLDPELVCLKYNLPFSSLKGINSDLLDGRKMT